MSAVSDWWPEPLRDIPTEDPLSSEYVVAAEITEPWVPGSYRKLCTALVPVDMIEAVLSRVGGIGYEVSANGPYPTPVRDGLFEPRFHVWAGEVDPDGLEPLVVAWEQHNRTTLVPDQGFLMTYGLMPRYVMTEDGHEIHWDELSRPHYSVVVVRPMAEYSFPRTSCAHVLIRKQFLQDYATLRKRCIVQCGFAQNYGALTEEIANKLGKNDSWDEKWPGREVTIHKVSLAEGEVLAKVWFVRALMSPGDAPISEGRWQYGSLQWPGLDRPVTEEGPWRVAEEVFVRDTVLEAYEGREGFVIHPETGGVSYGSQWAVSYCRRVGRDVIAVEVRKLYEGTAPDVVRHWHAYATLPPSGSSADLRAAPNVASRSKRIVYAMCALGSGLAVLSQAVGLPYRSHDFVKLRKEALDYSGWWTEPDAERIARHAPEEQGEEEFLRRAGVLHRFVVERLDEGCLRRTIEKMGHDPNAIKELRSLGLLRILSRLAMLARSSGLSLVKDYQTLVGRVEEAGESTAVETLRAVNEFRQLEAHRASGSRQMRLEAALKILGLHVEAVRDGWGPAFDRLYDGVGDSLDELSDLLREAGAGV
jgi:hypothetical protein